MIPWITRNLIYIPIYLMRGEHTLKYMEEIQKYHKKPAYVMRQIQWQKLIDILNYANDHNHYYKKLFAENSIDVKRIKDASDFMKIPILTKEAINLKANEMISTDSRRISKRKTSGSTGIPLVFVKDRDATAYMDAMMHEVYSWYGIELGDRQGRIWGMPLGFKARTFTQIKDLLLNRKRMVSFEINRSNSIDFYNILKKFKARFLYGLVNTTVEFTKELIDAGLDPATLRFNAVITTGEILFPFQRDFLKQAYQCPIVNEYGTTENGIVAFECKKGKLHLLTHNVYIEFINPETNQPAKPGELGEVIITELHSYAMPFIRYKVGDLARPSNETCDCGLELPVISEVVGRVSDLIITPDGRQVSSAILSYSMPKGVKRFRTFQKSPSGIEVLLQEKAPIGKDDLLSFEKKLRHYLGEEIKIDIKKVDTIPIDSSGKFRHFVTEIQHESSKVR